MARKVQTPDARRTVDVTVGKTHTFAGVARFSQTDFRDDLEGSVPDVIARLQEALQEVPAEYRGTASLYHTTEHDYGDSVYQRTYMTYQRPETDEEMEARIAKDKERADQVQQSELEQLKRLQAKYGTK